MKALVVKDLTAVAGGMGYMVQLARDAAVTEGATQTYNWVTAPAPNFSSNASYFGYTTGSSENCTSYVSCYDGSWLSSNDGTSGGGRSEG